MSYENIIFETEDAVAIIKFNRPKELNAVNPDVIAEVNDALGKVESDSAIKALVLTGEGDKAFGLQAKTGHFPLLFDPPPVPKNGLVC